MSPSSMRCCCRGRSRQVFRVALLLWRFLQEWAPEELCEVVLLIYLTTCIPLCGSKLVLRIISREMGTAKHHQELISRCSQGCVANQIKTPSLRPAMPRTDAKSGLREISEHPDQLQSEPGSARPLTPRGARKYVAAPQG